MHIQAPRLSLRTIVALVAVAIMAAFALVGTLVVGRAHDRMVADAERTMANYARLVALAHNQWMGESRPLLASLAAIEDDIIADGRCTERLAALLARSQGYDTFLIADSAGNVICAPQPLTGPVSLADRDYFVGALATKKFTVGEYIIGRVSGLRVLPVALPMLRPDGTVHRVIIAGKQLAWFASLIDALELPTGLHVGLLDRYGVELTTYRGQPLPADQRVEIASALTDAVERDQSLFLQIQPSDGVHRMVAFAPLGGKTFKHGIIVSGTSEDTLAQEGAFLAGTVGTLALALLVVLAAVLLLLQRFVVVPLARLVSGTRAVRAGDRAWRASGKSGGALELGELCLSLDAMLVELSYQEERIKAQARELERSNSDLQNFAYTVSHDLREPLRTISSFIKLIDRRYGGQLDSEGREFMAFVSDGAQRMSRMLDGVLEYSRINTRGGPPQPVALDTALDQALQFLTIAIEESGARIDRQPLPIINGDADQLARLFQNLIANAIKFHKPGEPPQVSITASRPEPGSWEIAVADNGMGLPAEGRDSLFQLFRRMVTREQVPGDGVGLALCKRIAERHGGTIRVDSEEGQGATFVVTLPAV